MIVGDIFLGVGDSLCKYFLIRGKYLGGLKVIIKVGVLKIRGKEG